MIKRLICLLLPSMAFSMLPQAASGALGDHWQRVRTAPVSHTIMDALWTGSEFIAVGTGIYRSSDGTTWEQELALNDGLLLSVAYSGSMYVVTGSSGTILYSYDGSYWQTANYEFNTNHNLSSVAWAGDQFIAVGENRIYARSLDGINWNIHSLPREAGVSNDVIWADGRIVVAGNTFSSSEDGLNWTVTDIPGFPEGTLWNGSQYLGVDGNRVYISPDGLTWEDHQITSESAAGGLVDWDGSKYTLANSLGVFTSIDGEIWEKVSSIPLRVPRVLLYANEHHYVFQMTGPAVMRSLDGVTWNHLSFDLSLADIDFNDVEFLNDRWFAVGTLGALLNSPDGKQWSRCETFFRDELWQIAWTGEFYVVVGRLATLTSTEVGSLGTSRVLSLLARGGMDRSNPAGDQFTISDSIIHRRSDMDTKV